MKNIIKIMVIVVIVVIVGMIVVYGNTRCTQLENTVKTQNQEISELKESNKKLADKVDGVRESNCVAGDGYIATVYDDNGKEHDIVITKSLFGYSVSEVEK